MKKIFTCLALVISLMLTMCFTLGEPAEAKTYKKLPANGWYLVSFKTAKIKTGKLYFKGTVRNWARSYETKDYYKKGKFVLRLTKKKKCKLYDGYKESMHRINKKKFNALCKKKDSYHQDFVVQTTKTKKIAEVRFW